MTPARRCGIGRNLLRIQVRGTPILAAARRPSCTDIFVHQSRVKPTSTASPRLKATFLAIGLLAWWQRPATERLRAALAPETEITAEGVAALIAEVETAAREADDIASKAHREALDPTKIVDTKSVAATIATAVLHRDRLQAALPLLRERYKLAEEAEYEATWRAEFECLEGARPTPCIRNGLPRSADGRLRRLRQTSNCHEAHHTRQNR
jgi:hypothetical protein